MDPGSEPVEDDEIVYRRVPADRWDYQSNTPLPLAFRPHETNDREGLSVVRQKYARPLDVARTKPSPCFVASLRVRDLRESGLRVLPDPGEGNPGHALIPELNSSTRRTPQSEQWQALLAVKLCSLALIYDPSKDRDRLP